MDPKILQQNEASMDPEIWEEDVCEELVPCAVLDCGVKVPEEEPCLDFASFIQQENLLTSLRSEEIQDITKENPLVTNPDASTSSTKVGYERTGKPVYGSISTVGYNALRSDFETEYDNQAELLLGGREDPMETASFPDPEDQELVDALQCAIVRMYNDRLVEREWRKRIVRDHALIDSKKLYTVQQRLEVPFGKRNLLILLKFMRFLSGPELDFIIEGIMTQISLRQKLTGYLNYRSQGIRFKGGIKIYENLNKKHLKNFNDLLYQSIALSNEIVGGGRSGRKQSAPLVLHNLPGYGLLDEDEKHLCSTVRLVPETYHNFKKLLIAECKRHDGLKLAVARQVVKIDVNKTRKMFDLLKSKGFIWPPKS
uniref:Transcriptional adapter 2-alpha n=1 Tax=Lygus hesperus TaxID=30085 RepID=A0A146M810_LYGHE